MDYLVGDPVLNVEYTMPAMEKMVDFEQEARRATSENATSRDRLAGFVVAATTVDGLSSIPTSSIIIV